MVTFLVGFRRAALAAAATATTQGTESGTSSPQEPKLHGFAEGFGVKAPEIEPDLWQIESTEEHRSGTISTDSKPAHVSDCASKCAIVRGVVTESSEAYELSNVVETALAKALVLAAESKRWDVVAQIAEELQRRGGGTVAGDKSETRIPGKRVSCADG